MSAARACGCVAPPAGWPALHLMAVSHFDLEAHDDATHRAHARARVREVLAAHADAGLAAAFRDAPRARRGAGRVSVGHERAVSLLAWCTRGRVGIDVVDPARLADAHLPELMATAVLFLGPEAAHALDGDRLRFAQAWARHEARLKCLGLELVEWPELPHAALAACEVAEVRAPGGAEAPGWVAWVAWRDDQMSANITDGEKSALSAGLLPRVQSSSVAAGMGRAK